VAEVPVQVQCRTSGQEASPVRFRLDNRDHFVTEVVDQWWGGGAAYYKVRTDDENLYILKHTFDGDHWALDSLAPKKAFTAR
jgi:hypothetical protein